MDFQTRRKTQKYISMIGDVNVGKTTLAQRYIKENAPLDQNIRVD